jgi:hypothetical protein
MTHTILLSALASFFMESGSSPLMLLGSVLILLAYVVRYSQAKRQQRRDALRRLMGLLRETAAERRKRVAR